MPFALIRLGILKAVPPFAAVLSLVNSSSRNSGLLPQKIRLFIAHFFHLLN
ncbi:MAG: hypothetical protein L6V88_02120 [Anaerotruncus sp.]|nr:MAG: hypothetical protein L6V88_02120 [Anaerotruncus sp.]